jgi:uncharacterized membrane protein
MSDSKLRHHRAHASLHGAFGNDTFGIVAERIARFFGTPSYILAQTAMVAAWIAYNGWAAAHYLSTRAFDPYPFILLNLAFSLQAAYAAPLILLAQTRQADRDKASEIADAAHREELSQRSLAEEGRIKELIQQNMDLTEAVHELTAKVHELVASSHAGRDPGQDGPSDRGAIISP